MSVRSVLIKINEGILFVLHFIKNNAFSWGVCVFICVFSPCHSSDVALIISPTTGNFSPPFHDVFDDEFSTLLFLRQQQQSPHWSQLVNQSRYLATDQNFELSNTWETILSPDEHVPPVPPSKGDVSAQQEGSWHFKGAELAHARTE